MNNFLSDQWFELVNQHLQTSLAVLPPDAGSECRVVVELTDVPEGLPQRLSLDVSPSGVAVHTGHWSDATATVRMSYVDAFAISSGQLDSASALREGRIKVRGDVTRLIPLTAWFQSAWAI